MVLVAVMLMAVSVGTILLIWNASATSFHYEREYPVDETRWVRLALDDLEDTNVTVAFTDDPALMYSIDVTLYEPGLTYTFEYEEKRYHLAITLIASGRIKSINVVLGTGTPYKILIRMGDNIDTTITYDSGAVIDYLDDAFVYSCTGTLDFNFCENVNFSAGGLDVAIGYVPDQPDPLYLDIDLPDGMDGRIDFGPDPVTFTQLAGWHHEGFGIYATASWPFENPGLDMTVDCGNCLADLHD